MSEFKDGDRVDLVAYSNVHWVRENGQWPIGARGVASLTDNVVKSMLDIGEVVMKKTPNGCQMEGEDNE